MISEVKMASQRNNNYRDSKREEFRRAMASDSYENGYEATRKFVERESAYPSRGKGRLRGGPSHKGYQDRRVVEYRRQQSKITESDLHQIPIKSEDEQKLHFPLP